MSEEPAARRARTRFHGRVDDVSQPCARDGCAEPGEFRAPADRGGGGGFDGPGAWQWLCLDHVRAAPAKLRILFRHLVENALDIGNPCLAGSARRGLDEAA